jgi:hypothetical protein
MKAWLLPVHLTFIGIWLGCVLTEALFERALLGQGRDKELILARLHKRVDLFVEIPAFVIVLVTGSLMLAAANPTALLRVKIGLGLLAIAANVYCVHLVFRRERFAADGRWLEFEAADHKQHKFGAVVLAGIVSALGVGLYLFAGGSYV